MSIVKTICKMCTQLVEINIDRPKSDIEKDLKTHLSECTGNKSPVGIIGVWSFFEGVIT